MIEYVTKANGSKEEFNPDKLNKLAEWAERELGVSWPQVLLKTVPKLYEGIETCKIGKALIDTCVSYGTEKHFKMASRLLRGQIYKTVWGQYESQDFRKRYARLVLNGHWMDMKYSSEELKVLSKVIDHDADHGYEYTSLNQFELKYARHILHSDGNKRIVETPQEMLMGIAMNLFRNEAKDKRLEYVKTMYDALKKRQINVATPIMASARTGDSSSASCCVITAGDTLESISAANNIAYHMTANRAGIGMEFDIRSVGDIVGNNKCNHAGKLPHYNMLVHTIKSVTQGARAGACTMSFRALDPEISNLLDLKVPKTPLERRINTLDYTLLINEDFRRRVALNLDWALVSIADEPFMYELFEDPESLDAFSDEMDYILENISKYPNAKVVKARDIIKHYFKSRKATGKTYDADLTVMNVHTPFKETIRLSNLCLEIALPTKAYNDVYELQDKHSEDSGTTALCFLLALDVARINGSGEYAKVAYIALRALDNIIEEMEYPFLNLSTSAKAYRSVGVGVTNLAYYMAKTGLKYSTEQGRNAIHELMELHSFSLLTASVKLAKERGTFEYYDKTKWADGWTPLDTYEREIDKHHSAELHGDWDTLKSDIIKYGVRFSTHTAHMPCESSSLWGYSTNSLYPIRAGHIIKGRGESGVLFIAPEWETLGSAYELAWDIETQDLYKVYGIIQKFTEQAISADDYMDYSKFPDGKVPVSQEIKNWLFSYKIGMKTHYYLNSKTVTTIGAGDSLRSQELQLDLDLDDGGCEDGVCTL